MVLGDLLGRWLGSFFSVIGLVYPMVGLNRWGSVDLKYRRRVLYFLCNRKDSREDL